MPDPISDLLDAAEAQEAAGDPRGALALLDQVIVRAPDLAVAHYRRGMLQLFELDSPGDALADVSRAASLGITAHGIPPCQVDYLVGEALFGLDRFDEARAKLTAALDANDDPVLVAEIQYRLAECADELGNEDDLRRALSAFLDRKEVFLESGGEPSWIEWATETLAELA